MALIKKNLLSHVAILLLVALLLISRLGFLYFSDEAHFPIEKIKIMADFANIEKQQITNILAKYLPASYFTFETKKLKNEILSLNWVEEVIIKRRGNAEIDVKIIEREPFAFFNDQLITKAKIFLGKDAINKYKMLPKLHGAENQLDELLQNYQKFSKLLSINDLEIQLLRVNKNNSWELKLNNGISLKLGRQDIEKRVERFCRAYPAVFKPYVGKNLLVDLRYTQGMAVKALQQTDK